MRLESGLANVPNLSQGICGVLPEWATAESPKLRDSNPSVVVIPGWDIFVFGRSKKEARIATEFFINAVHVMAGANALGLAALRTPLSAGAPRRAIGTNLSVFRITSPCRDRKLSGSNTGRSKKRSLQRMPAEAEFSRKILLMIGGASGIGREVALLLARKARTSGYRLDQNAEGAKQVRRKQRRSLSPRFVSLHKDLTSQFPGKHHAAAQIAVLQFGGIDGILIHAAIFPVGTGPDGQLTEAQWNKTFS